MCVSLDHSLSTDEYPIYSIPNFKDSKHVFGIKKRQVYLSTIQHVNLKPSALRTTAVALTNAQNHTENGGRYRCGH